MTDRTAVPSVGHTAQIQAFLSPKTVKFKLVVPQNAQVQAFSPPKTVKFKLFVTQNGQIQVFCPPRHGQIQAVFGPPKRDRGPKTVKAKKAVLTRPKKNPATCR